MNIHEKIKLYREEAGLTQTKLAELIGVTQSQIAQYETSPGEIDDKGKTKKSAKPSINKLQTIAEALGKDLLDLFDNAAKVKAHIVRKEIQKAPEKYIEFLPEKYQLKDTVLIPKLELRAGAGSEGFFDIEMLNAKGSVPVERHVIGKLDPKNLRAIEIVGDSMEPEFYEKDIAIMDMVNHRYDFVRIAGIYIVRTQEAVYIKRVDFMPKGGIKMMSINRSYGDIILTPDDDYEILGKVCGKVHYEIYKGLVFDDQGIK